MADDANDLLLDGFEIPEDFEINEPEAPEVKPEEVNNGEDLNHVNGDPEVNDIPIDEKEIVKEILDDEEDDVVVEDIDNPNNDLEVDSDNPDGELFKTLAGALKENGLLNAIESVDDITDVDKFTEAFRKEIKSSEYHDLNDTQKKVLDAFREGVPSEDILQHEQVQNQLASITPDLLEENEDLRKNIILTDLKAKGINDSRAMKLYQAMYDSGEDIDEAKESLKVMQENENARYQAHVESIKAQREAEIKNKEKEFNKLKENINNIDKFLGEIPVTETIRENVQKAMSIPVEYLEDGTPVNKLMKARLDDPITFETNLYYLFELTNGFKDLKMFSKRATSKAVKKLSKAIGNSTFVKGNGKPSYQSDPNSYSGSDIVEF